MSRPWIEWNEEKNFILKMARGVCFEDVEEAVKNGRLLDDVPHPRQDRYLGQRILVVQITEYVCLVPYVIDGERWFLKTIYPSRKARRFYLGDEDEK